MPEGLKESDGSRRRFRRFQVTIPALAWPECLDLDAEDAHEHPMIARSVFIENMSLTGILIVAPTPFYLGTRLIVKFPLGGVDFAVQADIRHIIKMDSAGACYYGHGSQFVRSELIADALPAIAAHLGGLSKNVRILEMAR
ncbi:hypothetical protein CCAX7_23530 [Capsulimonas corticalis]|uniref:PilZ domain-containing protein n=1 Tax=Capsulimonas corticalis TaxID=2219043 RepID=A0A9N7L3E1_9BACT|nr:hypothetical protein CCAX7_23530 [Capsulimonas corticalis]